MHINEAASAEGSHQFIKFLATGQEFATDIMSVREIRGWTETTKVPHAPHYVLGVINLRAVLTTAPSEVVAPVGIKGRFLGRLMRADRPVTVLLVGALFALSFDTISQAALFAVAGSRFGGVPNALLLGSTFLAGMLLTDGCNGLLIARLLDRSDELARVASRVMGLAVGLSSLAVAALGIARFALPGFGAWSEGRELEFGVGVVALVCTSFVAGRWLARRRPPLARTA